MKQQNNEIPLISVVIPSYNHKNFIEKTIASICTQNYERIQLIVIDDGSTDGSGEFIAELQSKYKHLVEYFVYISKVNTGLANTLNSAIEEYVTGDFMTIIASDDYLLEGSLKLRHKALIANTADVVFSECMRVDENDKDLGNVLFTKERFVKLVDLSVRSNFLPAPSAFYRTSVLKKIGGFDESLWFEDLDMWLRLLKADYKLFLLKERLVCYRDVAGSMSKQAEKIYKCACQIMDKHSDIKGIKFRRSWVFLSHYKAAGYKNKKNHIKAILAILKLMSPNFIYMRINTSGR
jgi:alpha-1,3-rhamnosyltransferase